LLDVDGRDLDGPAWAGAGHSLADELLRPSVVYAPSMLELRRHVDVHAYAHVTGGGIVGNLARVLPDHCDAVVRRDAWERPRIFAEVQAAGAVTDGEMEEVFNLGLGMLAVVPGDAANPALDTVRSAGHEAWAVGEITSGRGHAHMG
jgi:phosphoribosylformylglycinamidine cyclo-ligase